MIHKTISISYIIYNFVTLNLISIFLYGIFIYLNYITYQNSRWLKNKKNKNNLSNLSLKVDNLPTHPKISLVKQQLHIQMDRFIKDNM
jgi:cellulose synthase/poly-beta-1,6-N-acetylglucosamine synthase-like glycosyltransferase